MLTVGAVITTAFLYLLILFAIAHYGDRRRQQNLNRLTPYTYSLSLGVYCTTWTFFGSVGAATGGGIDFLAIYVGPFLLVTLGYRLVRKIVRLSKEERITSVADFLGARYGKSLRVAAVATLIATIGTIPYIALQLKAISASVTILVSQWVSGFQFVLPTFGDISILITIMLAVFTILFGTRHADATEHQEGLILAIAAESIVKLIAFLAVGVFTTWFIFDGFQDLLFQVGNNPAIVSQFSGPLFSYNFFVLAALSAGVFMLLPRQFHVAAVENHSEEELEKARWLFPLYLVLINIFVIPIAYAGVMLFDPSVNPDNFVIALPLGQGNIAIALLAFIGGLSAGTAMVVVASVALAIMTSNNIVLPLYLRRRESQSKVEPADMEKLILHVRRAAILAILGLAFYYYRVADDTAALSSIGLISFVAISQLAPAFFGGLFWQRATANGAMTGMIVGIIIWAYTLFIPTLLDEHNRIMMEGLFGLGLLKPQDILNLGFGPIGNGVFWSLLFNSAAMWLVSIYSSQNAIEQVQARIFVSFDPGLRKQGELGKTTATVGDLIKTISRYLGEERTERAFHNYWKEARLPDNKAQVIDSEIMQFSEHLLASAIGASSSRLVHTLLLKRYGAASLDDIRLLDEASEALKHNHDVLQSALDQMDQGVTVFDHNMRLASWNRQFRQLLSLPASLGQAGTPLSRIAKAIVKENRLVNEPADGRQLATRLLNSKQPWLLSLKNDELILEIRAETMPVGGMVITWQDITDRVLAAEALKEANETLERRVEERTSDLMILNKKLETARLEADQANASKTRFLAATGHDILQPLNAARLYTSSLQEALQDNKQQNMAKNISASLESVEEILSAILAISRLDTFNLEVKQSPMAISGLFEQLEIEFAPAAQAKGLELKFVATSTWTKSDRSLLRRLLQNLISNAIKYTPKGKILVGVRKRGEVLCIEVHDTGIGIDDDSKLEIFGEFKRLEAGARQAPGLGLGLSIVERIAKLLDHPLRVTSRPGQGTAFAIDLPSVVPVIKDKDATSRTPVRSPQHVAGTRVLCIDNDQSILAGMVALLSQWQCDVQTASSLEEALEAIERHGKPDIVLADYHLDKAFGLDVIAEIRKRHGAMPAVLITADRSEEVKEKAEEDAVLVLNKPLKPARLRAIISHEQSAKHAAE